MYKKSLKILICMLATAIMLAGALPAMAQCAVCSTNVETNAKNGGTQANGLNHGIMYLLAAPYIAVGAIGYLWYKKYRRKNVNLNMRADRINLN